MNESIRFSNISHRSELIRWLREEGIYYRIAEDGTLFYEEGHLVVGLIYELCCKIFPNGWYRAKLDDPQKRERYRRFKAFTGSEYMEEFLSDEHWFVQGTFEKLYRHRGTPTNACFTLAHDLLCPQEITNRLGVTPTYTCQKGEPFLKEHFARGRRTAAPLQVCNKGWWELCSVDHVESNDIRLHFEWLLKLIEPVEAVLDTIREEVADGSNEDEEFAWIQAEIIEPKCDIYGVTLLSSVQNRLNRHCDFLNLWFWPDDFL